MQADIRKRPHTLSEPFPFNTLAMCSNCRSSNVVYENDMIHHLHCKDCKFNTPVHVPLSGDLSPIVQPELTVGTCSDCGSNDIYSNFDDSRITICRECNGSSDAR